MVGAGDCSGALDRWQTWRMAGAWGGQGPLRGWGDAARSYAVTLRRIGRQQWQSAIPQSWNSFRPERKGIKRCQSGNPASNHATLHGKWREGAHPRQSLNARQRDERKRGGQLGAGEQLASGFAAAKDRGCDRASRGALWRNARNKQAWGQRVLDNRVGRHQEERGR